MRHAAASALLHGQTGLGAVEGLDLALLVDAQHHGPLGGVEIEADDVDQLLFEVGVVRELERPHQMRLDASRRPDSLNHGLGDPGVGGHGPTRPVRLGVRSGVQGVMHDGVDRLLGDRRLTATALGHLADALDAFGLEAGPPGQHAPTTDAEALGDFAVGHAVGGHH